MPGEGGHVPDVPGGGEKVRACVLVRGRFFCLLCSFRFVRNSMDGPTGTRLVGGRRRREGSSNTRSRRWHSLTQLYSKNERVVSPPFFFADIPPPNVVCVLRYVEEDLKEGLGKDPARVLSARPMDDPLEVIMYLTR